MPKKVPVQVESLKLSILSSMSYQWDKTSPIVFDGCCIAPRGSVPEKQSACGGIGWGFTVDFIIPGPNGAGNSVLGLGTGGPLMRYRCTNCEILAYMVWLGHLVLLIGINDISNSKQSAFQR